MATLSNHIIQSSFPRINLNDYRITSPETISYNCIAWAANDDTRWWEPDPQRQMYWPDDVPREYTIEAYIKLFEKFGYSRCKNTDFEIGYEKVAIYVDKDGYPSHVARQLSNGKWTSKLGRYKDIEHDTLECLINDFYGVVVAILRRKREEAG